MTDRFPGLYNLVSALAWRVADWIGGIGSSLARSCPATDTGSAESQENSLSKEDSITNRLKSE